MWGMGREMSRARTKPSWAGAAPVQHKSTGAHPGAEVTAGRDIRRYPGFLPVTILCLIVLYAP